MPNVKANGIDIEYDTFGASSSPALLLIIGLGGQMIQWDEAMCEDLATRGHYVVRFDNRDSGLSTKFEEAGIPNVVETINALLEGKTVEPPYTLEDTADDAIGLLDVLNIDKAHICGMSMGGMIAQTIALRHPLHTLSLISIYSRTGNPDVPQPKPEVMEMLLTPPPVEREAAIEHMMKLFKMIAGPGFPFDEKWHRKILESGYDRAFYPQGVARQLVAILTQKNRKPELSSMTIPTLIVHGTDDPLVSFGCGQDTAEAIPGSDFLAIEGMGHDLPHGGAWPQIVEAVDRHTHMRIA